MTGLTHITEIFKIQSQLEVRRDLLVLILAEVFWAQFKLAVFKNIIRRDEGRVEHEPEHHLLTRPVIFEDELYITVESEAFHLFLC